MSAMSYSQRDVFFDILVEYLQLMEKISATTA